jgi:biopolymer transport protein ExbD
MKFTIPEHAEEATFDLTPMVDVVMLLVIFFAFTAQFARTFSTALDLPREKPAGDAPPHAGHTVHIDMTREGRYLVLGHPIDPEWLVQAVARDIRQAGGPQGVDIVVRADRSASAAHLNTLAALLSRAGARTWKLATAESP